MPYNETLAVRIRDVFAGDKDVTEKKMFGGICFLVKGHMCCGIVGDDLMLRIGEALYDDSLKRPQVRPMDFTGKPLRGMIYVGAAGIKTEAALTSWLGKAAAFAHSLPAKKPKKRVLPKPKKPVTRTTR